jgi:hypothetical protein
MTLALPQLSRRSLLALSCAGIAALALPGTASAQDAAANSIVVDGVLAYLGVLPAAIIRGHPSSHSEGTMHGGVPEGRHQYHLVLALFDAATGARIEAARVSVKLMELGHIGKTRLNLEPMLIAGTVTWGAFAELPSRQALELSFDVILPGRAKGIVFPFIYTPTGD